MAYSHMSLGEPARLMLGDGVGPELAWTNHTRIDVPAIRVLDASGFQCYNKSGWEMSLIIQQQGANVIYSLSLYINPD